MKLVQLITLFGGAALAVQFLVAPRKYTSATLSCKQPLHQTFTSSFRIITLLIHNATYLTCRQMVSVP